jgi:hypothetical protein
MRNALVIILVVLVISFGIYYFWIRFDPLRDPAEFPLKLGSKGIEVATLQRSLNAFAPETTDSGPWAPLEITGIYDERTDKAMRILYDGEMTRYKYNELLAFITP